MLSVNQQITDAVNQLSGMATKAPPTNSNIRNNVPRVGNFTSSEIVALTKQGKKEGTWGVPALTYIEEKNMERRLQRCLTNEVDAHALTWGKFLEARVNDIIGKNIRYAVMKPLCTQ